jgi:hypothetical protein
LSELALNCDPPNLYLVSSWGCRYEPMHPVLISRICKQGYMHEIACLLGFIDNFEIRWTDCHHPSHFPHVQLSLCLTVLSSYFVDLCTNSLLLTTISGARSRDVIPVTQMRKLRQRADMWMYTDLGPLCPFVPVWASDLHSPFSSRDGGRPRGQHQEQPLPGCRQGLQPE